MNELPELDELVQVGLFNILEERDVQIRGYPVKFDIDVLILFSANPATYNRSGKVIPQLKDRIGSMIQTHYPLERELGVQILEQEAEGMQIPQSKNPSVVVPYFMKELIEEISRSARTSKYVDQESGVSARLVDCQLSHNARQCSPTCCDTRRVPCRAANQRPGPHLRIFPGQAGT